MPMAASTSPIRLPTSTVRDVPYEPEPCARSTATLLLRGTLPE